MSGLVVWLTGLPSSGKTTLARAVAARLRARGRAVVVLDGDEVRAALHPTPGYDEDGRAAFYATLGALAAVIARQGLVVLVPATANRARFRDEARAIAPRFVEVYVATPLSVCAGRDDKGLYARARSESGSTMPGQGATYEPPTSPEIVTRGDGTDVDRVVEACDEEPGA